MRREPNHFFSFKIEAQQGVGEQWGKLLQRNGIITVRDLLYYFPYRYVDCAQICSIAELNPNMSWVQIRCKLQNKQLLGQGRKQRMVALFADTTGRVSGVWFNQVRFVSDKLKVGQEYLIQGSPTLFNGKLNFTHPEIESWDTNKFQQRKGLKPYYHTSEEMKRRKLTPQALSRLIERAVNNYCHQVTEPLPEWFLQQQNLLPLHQALRQIHLPENIELLNRAKYRLKFEELFAAQLQLLLLKVGRAEEQNGFALVKVGNLFNEFYSKHLTFELTGAQKRVIKEIRKDVGTGKQMNRLLQGDVGSGKTIVAMLAMLLAVDNGYQAALMAPTEILANQHFISISENLKGLPIRVELLTGSTTAAYRRELFEDLATGAIHILIGTHALQEEQVVFHNLGMAIIDEQHRFGVVQRAKLWEKNDTPPHVLVMTATPIPRTWAMAFYGDLDFSIINELPPGRKEIQTFHTYQEKRDQVFEFIQKQVDGGGQAYIVYPLIQESETMDYQNLEEGFERVKARFPEPQYLVGMVHGQMLAKHRDTVMRAFARNEIQILVATTVIEVGVNVSNASIMVIESAERFGLSQLHQLRGRVGRGNEQAYCILMSSYKLSAEGRKRIETIVRTTDGFEIAEEDMKIRGPGDMAGTRQSGAVMDFKIANLREDGELLTLARAVAEKILYDDPHLKSDKNLLFKTFLRYAQNSVREWSNIS